MLRYCGMRERGRGGGRGEGGGETIHTDTYMGDRLRQERMSEIGGVGKGRERLGVWGREGRDWGCGEGEGEIARRSACVANVLLMCC